MGSTLEALRELQEIELQIVDIRRQLAQKERLIARQAAKLKTTRQAVAAEREEFRRAQIQFDELDLDLKARNANANRFREHLNTVRTNKEYAAVLGQLNNEKADLARLESRALELMERNEARKRNVTQHEEAERADAQRLDELKADLARAQASFADRLATVTEQREAAARKLNPQAHSLFERISERYEGEVMAKVVRVHPRKDEFMCEGCNIALAAERANALLTRDDVLTCGNCGRILYIEKGG